MERINVVSAPKTGTFQMRINPAVKNEVERICAGCGMTMTDAINIFLQQTINANGLPFVVTSDTREALRQQAIYAVKGYKDMLIYPTSALIESEEDEDDKAHHQRTL